MERAIHIPLYRQFFIGLTPDSKIDISNSVVEFCRSDVKELVGFSNWRRRYSTYLLEKANTQLKVFSNSDTIALFEHEFIGTGYIPRRKYYCQLRYPKVDWHKDDIFEAYATRVSSINIYGYAGYEIQLEDVVVPRDVIMSWHQAERSGKK